jgi:hypothetical protein
MSADLSIMEATADRLLRWFNAGAVDDDEGLCHPALTVHSALLGADRRSHAHFRSPLAALIEICHTNYPGIHFVAELANLRSQALELHWRAQFASTRADRPLNIPCCCRVQLEHGQIRAVRFIVDEYALLAELGRVCADPGQTPSSAIRINDEGVRALVGALVTGSGVPDAPFRNDARIRACVETYRDVRAGVELETFELDAVGELAALLDYLRARFAPPMELSFEPGLSQGATTTYRGKVRARLGEESQRYEVTCGLVSRNLHVVECWMKIAPPVTLIECLT